MAIFKLILSLAAVAGCVQSVATPSSNATKACNDLVKQYPNNVAFSPLDLTRIKPANLNFTYTISHYWNGLHASLVPSCVFYPTSANDVSFAVQLLNKYPDVPWATKSGGHTPNKNWSSTDQGILFSFRPFMQSTNLNPDLTADVQPGSRWTEAVKALEPNNRALVGGRLGDVGVGGYTLGGGLSFLSSQYGFACDLVQEYTIVLANGTIAKINQNSNTDLFYALKGGGNQFGIVTNYRMKTVPIGQVWGGVRFYGTEQASAILNATHKFASNYPDVKAAIIPTFNTLLGSLTNVFVVFYFYDGPTPPPGIFDDFNKVKPVIDQTKTQTYSSLLGNNDVVNFYGLNYAIRAQTIPLMDGDAGRDVLQYQYNSFRNYAAQTQPQNIDLMAYSFAMQPMPVVIQNASLASGSKNTFDFNLGYGDRIWMEYDLSWVNALDEANAFKYQNHFTADIVQYIKSKYPNAVSTHQTDKTADQYGPSFLNDAMYDQPTSIFYKPDTYQRLKKIQQTWDPKGFFSKRTGGAIFY